MFLMTVKDFKFLWFRDKAYLMEKPSIDRKNNNGNYTLKNCQFIELRKNRSKDNRGENNSNTKLTKKQVIKIRNLYKTNKYTYQKLVKKFKVSYTTICSIINYKTWTYI